MLDELPIELIQKIAEPLQCGDGLRSLASTSRRIRAVLLPRLYHTVTVRSYAKLEGLASASSTIVGYIHHLSFHIDWDFFRDWAEFKPSSTVLLLGSVLTYAPELCSLVIQLDNSPFNTPWNRFGCFPTMEGLPLNLKFEDLPKFDRLKHLELQATSVKDLPSLLNHACNLETLIIVSAEALNQKYTSYLMEGLTCVGSLKSFSASLDGWLPDNCSTPPLSIYELLPQVGAMLPYLESLDLRMSHYDFLDGALKPQSLPADHAASRGIASHLRNHFPLLQTLRLPLGVKGNDEEVTYLSRAIVDALPHLKELSWMNSDTSNCSRPTRDYRILREPQTFGHDVADFQLSPAPRSEIPHAMEPPYGNPQFSLASRSKAFVFLSSSFWSQLVQSFHIFFLPH